MLQVAVSDPTPGSDCVGGPCPRIVAATGISLRASTEAVRTPKCHHRAMKNFRLPSHWPIAGSVWLCTAVLLVAIVFIEQELRDAGRKDLTDLGEAEAVVYLAAVLSSVIVGGALISRQPRHPVGWLFAALGLSIALVGVCEAYSAYGALARPGSLPGVWLAITIADSIFIPWFALLTLILLLTPTGQPASHAWRRVAWLAVACGCLGFGLRLVSLEALQGPYEGVTNPIAPERGAGLIYSVRLAALLVLNASLVAAVVGVIVRYRKSRGVERQQLRWLVLAAVPIPPIAAATWAAAFTDQEFVLAILAGLLVTMLPVAVGLAISQYHLYDVDRLLSRALTYSLLSVVVIGCYVAVVVVLGNVVSGIAGDSTIAVIIATLAAVTVAGPARGRIQEAVDRRFNRRAFDARALMRRYVRDPKPGTRVESALAEALGDARLTVAYWLEERDIWVAWDGTPAEPNSAGLAVSVRGLSVACVAYNQALIDRAVVEAAVGEARAEIENARLRAAIALQLVEVRESRARIVDAQIAERRKIERNLHDGAQQRLLAMALQLRAAQVSGDPARAQVAIDGAVEQIQVAVRELRELANGLHPAILSDGGLAAALGQLAARTPVAVRVDATSERFPPTVESAAWFIACEAVTNAVKHAVPSRVAITASREDSKLVLTVRDDGVGGADPGGHGLRGIADRAEAAGGRMTIHSDPGQGTPVRAELPCAL